MTFADDARPPARPVDLDLLADYLAGELDGASARRVETLVDREPAWAASLAALRRADEAVRDTLGGLPAEPMPDAVFDRIMAALPSPNGAAATSLTDRGLPDHGLPDYGLPDHGQPGAGRPAHGPAGGPARGLAGAGPADGAGTRPGGRDDRAGSGGPPGRPNHRRAGGRVRKVWLGAGGLVAVMIIALVAFLPSLAETSKSSPASAPEGANDYRTADSGGPKAVPPTATNGVQGGSSQSLSITSSGFDYSQPTLGAPVPQPVAPGFTSRAPQFPGDTGTPQKLGRLVDRSALTACLVQVSAAYGGVPTSVDYARYEGQPALIVQIPSAHLVVAVGPDCGLPGSGTDVLATAPTG